MTALVNIACHVPARARSQPETLALVESWGKTRQLSFRQLDEESDALAHGLEQIGLGRGVRTVLMVQPSLELYTLTFALFKVGAVVVLIDPGMGIRGLSRCLNEAEPQAFVGVPRAHIARILLRWSPRTIRTCVTVGRRLGWSGWSLDAIRGRGQASGSFTLAPTQAEDLAAILFTSGSTGVAKGVMYSHGIFATQVEMLRSLYGFESGEVDLPTFPLFGLFAPALGVTSVIPEMDPTRPADVDPVKILGAITRFGVTSLFGSPALIRRVGEYGASHGVRLPTLRRVISAGAPVPARAIARFQEMLPPGTQVHTPYGATESLPVSSIGSEEILGETSAQTTLGRGVCVGRPVPGITVRIIRITDEPIEVWSDDLLVQPGEIGEIIVRGPVVTRSYHNRPEATRLAKIHDPQSGSIIHRMGDLGYLDEQGRIWFCGRKTQRVITPGGPLFTIPCEGVFNAHPAVYRTALVGLPREGDLEPALCVELLPEARKLDREKVRRELLELGSAHEHTRGITRILFHNAFPVDIRHNAKIFREKLAVWAARQR